jgi:hypothetical protein
MSSFDGDIDANISRLVNLCIMVFVSFNCLFYRVRPDRGAGSSRILSRVRIRVS